MTKDLKTEAPKKERFAQKCLLQSEILRFPNPTQELVCKEGTVLSQKPQEQKS